MHKLLRKKAVCEITSLSSATIRRLYLKGEFPKPLQLTSGGSVAWSAEEVVAWVESRQVATPETQRQVALGSTTRGRKIPSISK